MTPDTEADDYVNSDDPFRELQKAAARQEAEQQGARCMAQARAKLVLGTSAKAVFFATLTLGLKPRQDWTCDTAWTDGKSIGYNPDFWRKLTLPEQIAVLCHEVLHCASKHHVRRGQRDPRGWNIACDLAINHILRENDFHLPAGCLMAGEEPFKDFPRGKSAEEYYSLLPLKCKKGEGEGDGEEGGQDRGLAGQDPGNCGSVREPQDGSEAAKQQANGEWDVKLNQAKDASKQRGNLPGNLASFIEDVLAPKVRWREELREFVTAFAKNDRSWFPPSRRALASGVYLPSSRSEELDKLIVCVDTSGSCWSEAILTSFASEVQGILDAFTVNLTVIYLDYQVQEVVEWNSADGPLVFNPKGGGGTSHIPLFEYIEEQQLEPAALICLTDMYTSFPPVPPPYPVLWVSVTNVDTAPFGRVINIEVDPHE